MGDPMFQGEPKLWWSLGLGGAKYGEAQGKGEPGMGDPMFQG